jgi:hypothetical protein
MVVHSTQCTAFSSSSSSLLVSLVDFWVYFKLQILFQSTTHHNFVTVTKEPVEHFQQRLQSFRQFLESRNEKTIVVVSHAGALKALTNADFTLRNLEICPLFLPFKKK